MRALGRGTCNAPTVISPVVEVQPLCSAQNEYFRFRPATEQPKKSCRANSESKRKNRPKEASKPRFAPSISTERFRASRVRQSRTAGLAGVTMYPVSGSPISKDSLRGLSRQRSAISTHNTESILSWSAFCGWSILPASRHHPAISSQPSAWKPCAAASVTRAQSSLRKVFLRSGLYFGPASRPKNPESSDGRARAGKRWLRVH
jgi:hypothetical protein